MAKPEISGVAPLFIVKNVPAALSFYRDRLGFDVRFQGPADDDIFFGIVQRGAAMIMVKDVGVDPLPNYTRWDSGVNTMAGKMSRKSATATKKVAVKASHRAKSARVAAKAAKPRQAVAKSSADMSAAKRIDFREGDEIDETALKALLRQAIAYNTKHSVPKSQGSRATIRR
jgi:catechol 2,3-dioxygenase-like lactoylglutathione lyase family enzyme